MTNCTLKIISGPENGQEFACPGADTFLGRSQRCTVRLTSASVSYEHAVVSRQGDDYYIENLSANGTFVNGERIARKTRLHMKDRIRLGADTTARVTALPAAAGASSTRRALLVAVVVMVLLGIALIAINPFARGGGFTWADWQRADAALQQFVQEQTAARTLPQDTDRMLQEAWRLESAGDRAGAGAQWVRLHVLLSGRGDASGVEEASAKYPNALRQLLTPSKDPAAPDDEELKAALLQFVVSMEKR
jgi:hypothetical protein